MSTDEQPRRFEPPVSEAGAPYWEGTREGRLLLPWCTACERPHWYPREVCPHCLGDELDWREASGRAVVHAASIMPKPALPQLADRVPYVVALVELVEGVRMLTNVVDAEPETIVVGLEVELAWEPLTDGRRLAVFRPAPTADGFR